ncbi:hypothetical protein HDIA_4406 [Hartmannibacter diazotrophicus]|uniref:Uncharacterized protein n=1 Tax=Hartmannibacter diazotrophicus TaxID=1482074 RepID=A0A2C9DCB7_9HYPH|nr:hypothetical protein [Hartmannibacter diazotrophicus]SON57947.1 hypothetical protein HDIA_4406 [Hartmannibacter diazotrophicus]
MLLDAAILAVACLTGLLLARPRLARLGLWQATITPLASIIGSGFLVLGPVLDASYGGFAPLAMALLCLGAYLLGGAVRFNIARLDATGNRRTRTEDRLETAASWSLAFAYVISVAYYLNLFGAFGVSLTPLHQPVYARALTSLIFLVILGVGWRYGFKALEGLEQISVTLKLAIIAGLILGLLVHWVDAAETAHLAFAPPRETGWSALTLGFGLIVTVQGFETSRYLGSTYDAATRIRSMRWSQWISTAIYLVYVALVAYDMKLPDGHLTETSMVDMMAVVAPILPLLLVAAALSAQFSAAIADTSGCGGLVEEGTRRRVPERWAYAVLVAIGLGITWTSGVFEIISYASRAFALYYALQAAIAMAGARAEGRGVKAAGFAALAVLALLVTVFGTPTEG